MSYFKKKFRNIKKFPRWIYWLPAQTMRFFYYCTMRRRIDDPNNIINADYQMIGLAWHNRLFYFPCSFEKNLGKNTMAVISASRDGQYISDLVSHFGIGCLRGSSSRGGANAQREAIRAIQNGKHIAITPDGPRGPRYTMKRGPVQLASITGKPIVLVAINASKYWQFKSWDGFQIPKPGAVLTLVMRGPFYIPADLDDAGIEKYTREMESKLREITVD